MCERHSSFRLGAIVSPDYLWGVSRTFTIFFSKRSPSRQLWGSHCCFEGALSFEAAVRRAIRGSVSPKLKPNS